MDSSGPLKAKIVIGNIKCKQNYSPDDKAFHSSDVPEAARLARLHAKAWKRPTVLGGKIPPWNADSSTSRPLCERSASQLIIPAHLRPKPSTERDEREAGWASTTQLTEKEVLFKVCGPRGPSTSAECGCEAHGDSGGR